MRHLPERQSFIDWLESKGLAEKSVIEYMYWFDRYEGSFDQEGIDNFLQTHYNNSVTRALLKNIITYLIRQGDVQCSQLILPPTTGAKKKRLPKVLSEEEVLQIERYLPTERLKLMLLVTFYGGVRKGELYSIHCNSFNWDLFNKEQQLCEVTVLGKRDKERIVYIPKELAIRVANWINENWTQERINEEVPLFKVTSWGVTLSKYGKIALQKRVYPHLLRHSRATNLLDNDMNQSDIKEYLGHENISTTDVYLHISRKDLKNKFAQLAA